MKLVIAIDSFKGSMTSKEAGIAAAQGIRKVFPDADICIRPLADGGEGTVTAITEGMGGSFRTVTVIGPGGKPAHCRYGILPASRTAVIEMSGAAGITLVHGKEKNPLHTTTYGVGQVILDAISQGCRKFIVGIGGSATNDGGVGMLQALGFDFLDASGDPIPYGAQGLSLLKTIDNTHALPELKECTFRIACDVTNPLCGPEGCSAIFGPQKGADSEMITLMDPWLAHFASLAGKMYPNADPDYPGCGAAGGLGFAFRTFLNASLESGIKIVLEETHMEDYIKDADIILTGEGRLDAQTVMGKAPQGVAQMAKKYGKPVLAFSGCVTPDAAVCNQSGIDAFFPILRSPVSLEEAMDTENAKANMSASVEQVFRVIKTFIVSTQ